MFEVGSYAHKPHLSLRLLAGRAARPKEVVPVEVFLADLLGLHFSHDSASGGQSSERLNLHPAHERNRSLVVIEVHLHTH